MSDNDSVAVRQQTEEAVKSFLARWRRAWLDSDSIRFRNRSFQQEFDTRAAYAHCHPRNAPGQSSNDSFPPKVRPNYEPVVSEFSYFAKCPTWMLGVPPSPTDEADNADAAILPQFARAIKAARFDLIERLAIAQKTIPTDDWIAGQYVRFLADQGRLSDALQAAKGCSGNISWCSALTGYALHRLDHIAAAESAFQAAAAALPLEQRCEWTDISALLPRDNRASFTRRPCATRDSLSTTFFWLSDPLLSERGNERYTEHYARKVLVMLHAALPQDERYFWTKDRGGDAIVETVLRYGWPTSAVWAGKMNDRGHDSYLKQKFSRVAAPYSTAEYSSGRVRFSPGWDAVVQPSLAHPNDWDLHAPAGQNSDEMGNGSIWWPAEHMRWNEGSIVELPAPGQIVFWRRQHVVRVVAGANMLEGASRDISLLLRRKLQTYLVTSAGPDTLEILSNSEVSLDEHTIVDGVMRSRAQILGIEVQADITARGQTFRLAARTRIGISPPTPLDSLVRGDIALSDPAFLAVTTAPLPTNAEEALPIILATPTAPLHGKVGLFWESYGVAAGDSVQFSINVIPAEGPSFLRRVTSALRITQAPVATIGIRWKEPETSADSSRSQGLVPIRPHSLVLDLSQLKAGAYWIEITANASNKPPAGARRLLTIGP